MSIQNSVQNEKNPVSPFFSLRVAFLSILVFVWVSRDDPRSSSTPTERKRESNVDHDAWFVAVAYFSPTREIDTRESISLV